MTQLIHSFSLPWQFWIGFGFFVGAILFNHVIRREFQAFVAHVFGLQERNKKE